MMLSFAVSTHGCVVCTPSLFDLWVDTLSINMSMRSLPKELVFEGRWSACRHIVLLLMANALLLRPCRGHEQTLQTFCRTPSDAITPEVSDNTSISTA